eukprot:gene14681-20718_t
MSQAEANASASQNPARAPSPCCNSVAADSFECSICCDILLDPVVFPCGHDSCSGCYATWVQQSHSVGVTPACPLCRYPLPGSLSVCLRLKSTVESLFPAAAAARRSGCKPECEGLCVRSRVLENAAYALSASWYGMAQTYTAVASCMLAPQAAADARGYSAAWYTRQTPVSSVESCATRRGVVVGVPVIDYALANQQEPPKSEIDPRVEDKDTMTTETGSPIEALAKVSKWQSAGDQQLRLQIARSIMSILKSRGGPALKGDKLLAAVRLIEVLLYRNAKSRSVFSDLATLESRALAVIRRRGLTSARS